MEAKSIKVSTPVYESVKERAQDTGATIMNTATTLLEYALDNMSTPKPKSEHNLFWDVVISNIGFWE